MKAISSLRFSSREDLPGFLVTDDPYWLKNGDEFEMKRRALRPKGTNLTRKGYSILLDPEQGRKLVSINPYTGLHWRVVSIRNGLKKRDLLLLIQLSFTFDETIGWMVREKVLDKAQKFDEVAKAEVLFASTSEHHADLAISWYFRSFQSYKGYVEQRYDKILRSISFVPPRKKLSRRRQRIRGYRDKGSLPASDQWIEKDFTVGVHREIETLDHQLRTLLEISASRGYFVPQDLLEELLSERRNLLSSINPIGDYSYFPRKDE